MARPKTRSSAADVVVIGGGIMGCACAFRLASAGAKVVVLEKSVPGAEASSAAAGILGASAEAHGPGPMADLLAAGLERYPAWSEDLARATGIDVEFRRSGVLRVAKTAADARRAAEGSRFLAKRLAMRVSPREVARLEPSLSGTAGGVRFPHDARVEPKQLLKAVHVAALRAGARFETGKAVRDVTTERGAVRGVVVEDGTEFRAPTVVVAAGSWSTHVPGVPLPAGAVIPARGQIVELETSAPPLGHVVMGPRCYLVPRDDGRVLVGATVEFVGYLRGVTARGVRDLLDAAIELAPDLGGARIAATWSSFRPYTKDELPLIGRTPIEGLLLATGHFRNGILLAPITAEIVAALAAGAAPPVDVASFEAKRLAR